MDLRDAIRIMGDDMKDRPIRPAVHTAYDRIKKTEKQMEYLRSQTVAGSRDRLTQARDRSPDTATALDHLAGLYLEIANQIDQLRAIQTEAKDAIGEIFVETGQTSADTSAARLTISRPGVSVRYDAKALDVLIQSDPRWAALLEPHRTETERAGTLTIRGRK